MSMLIINVNRIQAMYHLHPVAGAVGHLLEGGLVDDDRAVDEGDHHDHAEHDGEEHAEAKPFLAPLRRQLGFRHLGRVCTEEDRKQGLSIYRMTILVAPLGLQIHYLPRFTKQTILKSKVQINKNTVMYI